MTMAQGSRQSDVQPRCWRCGRMLAWLATRPWDIQCGRCKAPNRSQPREIQNYIIELTGQTGV